MTPRLRYSLLAALTILAVGVGIYFSSIFARVKFYSDTKNFPTSIVPALATTEPSSPAPNIDLGVICFYCALTPETTFKKSDYYIIIKEQERSILISFPEPLAEIEQNPNFPNNLEVMDLLISKYGNMARASKAAFETKTEMGVLFPWTSDYECQKCLTQLRTMSSMFASDRREFLAAPGFDALITTRIKARYVEVYWSTTDGARQDQMHGTITIVDNDVAKNPRWHQDLIRSLVIRDKSKIITPDEMLERLEKLKPVPPTGTQQPNSQ